MKKKKRKIWLWFLSSIIIIFAILIGTALGIVSSKLNKMEKVTIDKSNLGIEENNIENYKNKKEIKNIALFGIDSDDDNNGRSDAIMIATIDAEHNKLKLTSLMRDSYVNIEGYGMDKLNHAYAYGGPQLSIKTINENFGLNIDSFMSVNFSSLPVIIDLLDGVDISIAEDEVPYVPGISEAGTYTLTGGQALSYSRIRSTNGDDYRRTERQRTLLNALFTEASTMPKSSYLTMLDSILPYVKTNMSSSEILSLGTSVFSSYSNGLQQLRFPLDGYSEGTMIDGVYYLTFDQAKTKQQVMDYIFDDKNPQ